MRIMRRRKRIASMMTHRIKMQMTMRSMDDSRRVDGNRMLSL